ncbi:hypothetical protein [Membranihabitans marinus]|uniref:hypothetical protein n=1 Tax=Membranihabitans marinus TaxID=1227546 RepID=UPI001F37D5BB|nr:hypothetical protein [Membranihabitans marinus]
MKNITKPNQWLFITLYFLLVSCTGNSQPHTEPDSDFASYWYQNQAEISSFELNQVQYGEIRKGEAVLIFVTEPFSSKEKVKEDHPEKNDYTNVLKLNFTKKFNTGLYPYSMMNSTFLPIQGPPHSLKIAASVQEWCGQTYMELKNNSKYNVVSNSYFQGEGGNTKLPKNYLEDDFWSLIRINPQLLPTGEHQVIPSFFFFRMKHKEVKAYQCVLTKEIIDDEVLYQIEYPELDRKLKIYYNQEFPYRILRWEESDGKDGLSTTGKLKATLLAPYWKLNHVNDEHYRDSLLLGQ